ncbi:MAG: helix-hairpin-helix domain-containing protein [Gudongella sp.]|nr:helix-hairpin-helix domain-containing protein [Gudongella sp.]
MDFFTRREQLAILSIAAVLLAFFGVRSFISKNSGPPASLAAQTAELENIEEYEPTILKPQEIMVHISGQVYHPGLYELIEGSRVSDVVKMAGGLTKSADMDRINLAKKISDEEKIYIPSIDEAIPYELEYSDTNGTSSLININTCSQKDLESLPGIGEVIAGRIIEYREQTKFSKIEDIRNVSGIGDSKFEAIKELITTN